jgi:plasmid replication initiation protein
VASDCLMISWIDFVGLEDNNCENRLEELSFLQPLHGLLVFHTWTWFCYTGWMKLVVIRLIMCSYFLSSVHGQQCWLLLTYNGKHRRHRHGSTISLIEPPFATDQLFNVMLGCPLRASYPFRAVLWPAGRAGYSASCLDRVAATTARPIE